MKKMNNTVVLVPMTEAELLENASALIQRMMDLKEGRARSIDPDTEIIKLGELSQKFSEHLGKITQK